MQASGAAVSVIKDFESDVRGNVRLVAFDDGYGNYTIGWGRVNHPDGGKVRAGEQIDLATAERYLREDLGIVEAAIAKSVKVPLSQGQFDALAVFGFNVGPGALAQSTVVKLINAGKLAEVPAAWMRWIYATNQRTGQKEESRGLVRRRRAELELWRGLVDADHEQFTPAPGTITAHKPGAIWDALTGSGTIRGALLAALGTISFWITETVRFAADAVAAGIELQPVKDLAHGLGAQWPALAMSLTAAGVVLTISRRIGAAKGGKIG